MKNLFQPEAVDEVITRLDALQPATQRQWGKMDAAQMMAHCSASFDLASGRLVRPRVLLGWVVGPLLRAIYSNEKPFWKNSPTDEKLIVSDPRDFSREREQLKARIRQFHLGGETQVTKHPHPFFGSLSAHEWSTGMYKHLDHHLRQFGV